MDKLQALGRAFFRAYVVCMLTFMMDPKGVYGLPLGLLVGMLSESKELTKNNNQTNPKKDESKNKDVSGG